jgi:hypothetical protein
MLTYHARPDNLLVYYGYPNSFNSAVNGWNNEKVAQDMAKYEMIVLGDGVQNPAHPDFTNIQTIIPRIKAFRPNVKIFGYVTINQDLEDFQTKVNQWDDLQVYGIFLDEAGYDYGKTRAEFNDRVTHVKSRTYAKKCFANSWNIDHVLGTIDDPSYPNATYNPALLQSILSVDDWCMLESFSVNTTAYAQSYASKADWYSRGQKAADRRNQYNVRMAALHVINDDNMAGQTLFYFAYNSSLIWAIDSVGSSSTNYGASSAQVNFWRRPNKSMGTPSSAPSVLVDAGSADILIRYGTKCKMEINYGANPVSTLTCW